MLQLKLNCCTMARLLLALSCLALLLAVAAAEPRYARLAQPKVGCSLTEIVACEAEIEGESKFHLMDRFEKTTMP